MMKTPTHLVFFTATALLAALLLGACGVSVSTEGPGADQEITALDLESGERKLFKSTNAVPERWAICEDARCIIPDKFPCIELGPGACLFTDARCEVKLRCGNLAAGGDNAANLLAINPAATVAKNSPENRYGAPQGCEFTCITREEPEPSCGDLGNEQDCEGRSDCYWEWLVEPPAQPSAADAEPAGDDSFMPCDSDVCATDNAPSGLCLTWPPPTCYELSQTACARRDDCTWNDKGCGSPSETPSDPVEPLPNANPQDPPAPSCEPSCEPAPDPPPVCNPPSKPACAAGKRAIELKDDNDCIAEYRCEAIAIPEDCGWITDMFDQTLLAAKTCSAKDGGELPQAGVCTATAKSSLVCGCPTPVDPDKKAELTWLDQLIAAWDAQGCGKGFVCSAVMCPLPSSTACGSQGSCLY